MQTPPQNDISTWVRNYVHYDNLANNYGKQAAGARKLRDDFETKIIHQLRAQRMENAVIQVAGARLQCGEEKCAPTLTMPRLESYLHDYFKQRGNHVDETDAILRFIKQQKTDNTQRVLKLKKTASAVALPPPPGAGGAFPPAALPPIPRA